MTANAATPERAPATVVGRDAIQDLVLLDLESPAHDGLKYVTEMMADIEKRKVYGMNKYGTLLHGYDGRDTLMDLYQELLDAVQYAKKLQYEGGPPQTYEALLALADGVCGLIADRS